MEVSEGDQCMEEPSYEEIGREEEANTSPNFFICNHPFVFLVVDRSKQLPLLVGRVLNPLEG